MLKVLFTFVIIAFMLANVVKIVVDFIRIRNAKKIYKELNLIGKDK